MAIGAREFAWVSEFVRRESSIVLEPGMEYLVETRLATLARGEGFASVDEFLAELRARPANGLHQRVVEAMTTNETSFFRDLHPFDAFRQVLLPELLVLNAATRRLSVWCAACSSGQEPYSLAMLLRDEAARLAGWTVRILATDLSAAMVARAQAGRYSQLEVNRGLPAPMLVRHFTKHGAEWVVKDELRAMVEFRTMNLAAPFVGLPPFDVVFLRNVLIYFDVATKRDILGRVRRVLRPGGCLFLGSAETTLNLDDAYQRVTLGKAVAYRSPGG